MVVVRLSWLSGRALAAQDRCPEFDSQQLLAFHFPLFSPQKHLALSILFVHLEFKAILEWCRWAVIIGNVHMQAPCIVCIHADGIRPHYIQGPRWLLMKYGE